MESKEENDNLNEKIKELPDVLPDEDEFKPTLKLELPGSYIYQLTSIEKLNTSEQYKQRYANITFLNVNNNDISYFKLKGYSELEEIWCSNNHINHVDLYLPRLRKLDISRNKLTKMFELVNVPNLEEINLNQNSLTTLSFDIFSAVKHSLRKLEVCENLIQFNEVKEFFYFIDNFGNNLKKIKTLNISGNPFCYKKKYKDDYENCIIKEFEKLEILNSRQITINNKGDSIKKRSEILPKGFDMKKVREAMYEQEKKEKTYLYTATSGNIGQTVTIKMINSKLLIINQIGKVTDKDIEDLEDLCDSYLNNIEVSSNSQARADLDDTEVDDFEIMVDLLMQIIDGATTFEKRLFTEVGNFATVKYGKFSSRSLNALKQRITANNYDSMVDVLTNILTFLRTTKEDSIPCSLIESLQVFITESKLSVYMVMILKRIMHIGEKVGKNLNFKDAGGNIDRTASYNLIYLNLYNSVLDFVMKCFLNKTGDLFNTIIADQEFLRLVIHNLRKIISENVEQIISNESTLNIFINLLGFVTDLVLLENAEEEEKGRIELYKKKAIKPHDQLIIHLENKTRYILGKENYNKFKGFIQKSGLRDRIENNLATLFQKIYVNDKEESDSKELAERIYMYRKKKVFISLARCYGSLLSVSEDVSRYLDDKSLSIKIICILSQNEIVCPMLVRGACDFTNYFLRNKEITENQDNFVKISKRLYNYRFVMPYLDPKSEEHVKCCQIAEKYGFPSLEKGKPIEIKRLDNEIMNNLNISIIDLMSFFGKNLNSESKIKTACQDICSEMNKLKRDAALTGSLQMMSEEVKISVVKCLFYNPVNELSSEEIMPIYKNLSYKTSITPGYQRIISITYLIINKWFLYHLKQKKDVEIETSKEAVYIAVNLLMKEELKKSPVEEENQHKRETIAVLVMFLINISCFEYSKKYLEDPKNAKKLKEILDREEESVTNLDLGFPIEIEKCYSGWNMDNILSCIKNGLINPYNYVSLRIMHHVAELLWNRPYEYFHLDYELAIEDILFSVIYMFKEREINRIKDETISWRKLDKKYAEENFPICVKLSSQEELKKQQSIFIKNFKVFIEFSQGKCSEAQINQFSKIWAGKYNENIDKIIYTIKERPFLYDEFGEKIVLGGEEDKDNFPTKRKLETENPSQEKLEGSIYDRFKDYLKREEFNASQKEDMYNLNYTNIRDDLFQISRYGEDYSLKRIKSQETPNNSYLRSLFVSALLRCIYCILEKPADKTIKDELIKTIFKETKEKNNYIIVLCQLTECTKFIENEISTKFMVVINQILQRIKLFYDENQNDEKNGIKKTEEDLNNELLVKMGYISYVIRKVVRLKKRGLNLENDEHLTFLSETCNCCSSLINQLNNMKFGRPVYKEATICTMIDMEVINVIIETIKKYMNKTADKILLSDTPQNALIRRLLLKMIQINISIIGDYISKCPGRKYEILESFATGYIFDRVRMRKTFLQEVINYSRISNLQSDKMNKLEEINGNSKTSSSYITFVGGCILTNFKEHKNKEVCVVVTESQLEFWTLDFLDDIYNSFKHKHAKDLRILTIDIVGCIIFDCTNRILIQTRDEEFGFIFQGMREGLKFAGALRDTRSKITFYEFVNLFPNSRSVNWAPSTKKKKRQRNKEDDDLNLIDEEKIKKANSHKPKIQQVRSKDINFNCYFNTKELNYLGEEGNYLKGMKGINGEKNSFLGGLSYSSEDKEMKIGLIKDDIITFYKDKQDEWAKIDAVDIFDSIAETGINCIDFVKSKCFVKEKSYSVNDFESLKEIDGNKIYLKKKRK